MVEPGGEEMPYALINKKVYVHNPTLPRSSQTDTNAVIVVINRNRVLFEKLRVDDQHDYKMKIDAIEMLPPTWQHAGLPPDGTFAPKRIHDPNDPPRDLYSDFEGFMILVTVACNLILYRMALSYHDQALEKAKVEWGRSNPPLLGNRKIRMGYDPAEIEKALKSSQSEYGVIITRTTNTKSWDELDEKRMSYVLGMLVRLFYRGADEMGKRDWNEQELRKAIIHYLSGTGGTSQLTNFTSLFMALELAVGFAESKGIRWRTAPHRRAAVLFGDAVHRRGIDPTKSESPLIKTCIKILGKVRAGRINEYLALNNRIKHYGRSDDDAKYFDSNADDIVNIMAYLRADAAYVILLGLEKLYGTGNLPTQMSKSDRTSQIILNMIEDCVDRHGEYNLDGDVKSKIQSLGKIVDDDAIKSVKIVYDDTQSVLGTLKMLVQVAEMLGAPGGCEGVRELVREYEDVAPDKLKPSEYGLVGEYGEKAIRIYLLHLAHRTVLHMDNQFGSLYTMIHIARHGRMSGIKCNPGKF